MGSMLLWALAFTNRTNVRLSGAVSPDVLVALWNTLAIPEVVAAENLVTPNLTIFAGPKQYL